MPTIRQNYRRETELSDFIKFVDNEQLIVSNPLSSKAVVDKYLEKRPNHKRYKISAFATGEQSKKGDLHICINCNGNHKLENCKEFMEKPLKERIKFLMRQKRCYGCLEPMSDGRNTKTCTSNLMCSSCKGNHPTLLHGYVPKDRRSTDVGDQDPKKTDEVLKNSFAGLDDLKCAATSKEHGSNVISMCVVPVKVKHEHGANEVTTYAMLDNCSQGSFIHDSVVKKLGVTGSKTTINLKTLHGVRSEKTVSVEGIKVAQLQGNSIWLNLPKMYARRNLPVDKEEIATPARISKWEYLKPISNEIVQDEDIVVGLLIGANCMKALEPMKIIPSKEDGPYAYKTLLGWCIVGPIINTETERSISCHRVAVKDVTSSRLAPHHFGVEKSIKDISLEEMFKMMYSNDFNEHDATVADSITSSVDEISIEDKKFLDIVEKNTSKKDYHYVVPLPFRDGRLVMPNNRVEAFRRLMFLKQIFLKDQKFFDDYKTFMDNLLVKGYLKQSEVVLSGKTLYIPHHDVYHPSKPGKVRVAFDCSAEFQGKSINRELLSGPDLTNQIIGTMARFREEKIAFMADIEAMLHQVLVLDDQQTLLKFLLTTLLMSLKTS